MGFFQKTNIQRVSKYIVLLKILGNFYFLIKNIENW